MGYVVPIITAISAGVGVYSTVQQSKSAKAAAEFNAEQTRNAAKVKAEDDRTNALRRQEQHRKYLASIRARMLENGRSIEGGNMDFLNEAAGSLQMRILDAQAASNREQASYENQAFRYDWQADQAQSAGTINTAASALSGFNSVYRAGQRAGYWDQPKRNPEAYAASKPYASSI